jgi:nucleoside-diphosphate-sugar epimerase
MRTPGHSETGATMKRILVTGAVGQVGTELVPALRRVYGEAAVLATDVREPPPEVREAGPWTRLDCMDMHAVARAVREHEADGIYHLAALLSARGEEDPQRAYTLNMGSLYSVLEVAREAKCMLFSPSSIAAFGPGTPRDPAPQDTVQRPRTMYGVTKVAGELLCDYYHIRFGVDVRGVRYPGLISYVAQPGGGTTDYAVEIFYQAIESATYTCFLSADTQLDMMYMPDAIRAAMELMEADASKLLHRNAFNVTAMQLTPETLAAELRKHIPAFRINYRVDPVRQAIAESWPRRIDDSAARKEWGWQPAYDLHAMTTDMLHHLGNKLRSAPSSG